MVYNSFGTSLVTIFRETSFPPPARKIEAALAHVRSYGENSTSTYVRYVNALGYVGRYPVIGRILPIRKIFHGAGLKKKISRRIGRSSGGRWPFIFLMG